MGYAVSRKVGSAVVRNRIRRRCRAVVASAHEDGFLVPGLYLVGVKGAKTATLDFGVMRADLLSTMIQASGATMNDSI